MLRNYLTLCALPLQSTHVMINRYVTVCELCWVTYPYSIRPCLPFSVTPPPPSSESSPSLLPSLTTGPRLEIKSQQFVNWPFTRRFASRFLHYNILSWRHTFRQWCLIYSLSLCLFPCVVYLLQDKFIQVLSVPYCAITWPSLQILKSGDVP